MRTMTRQDVVISLREVHAHALLSGTKCVELRRRAPRLGSGTRVWFYSKVPAGKIVGFGILEAVNTARPFDLWSRFEHCSGLSESAFFNYFEGAENGAALVFSKVATLKDPLSLATIKALEPRFHPPQFFAHLKSELLLQQLQSSEIGTHHGRRDHELDAA